MNLIKICIISFLVQLTLAACFYPMGQKIRLTPMKSAKLELKDGELLKYARADESASSPREIYFVSKFRNDPAYGKVVDIHIGWAVGKDKSTLPLHYTNFQDRFTVSLNDASLIYEKIDDYTNHILNDRKGIFYQVLDVDKKENTAGIETKSWDGSEVRISRGKVKIKPGFPVFDLDSLTFVAVRYLDIESKGIIYILEPGIMKEPLPVSFQFIKNEDVTTPAGRFGTVKIGGAVADPFLGKLIKPYLDNMFMWVENSERRLIVRMQFIDSIWVLESISETRE